MISRFPLKGMNEDMVEVIFQSQREINEEDGCLNEAYVEGCKVFKKKGGGRKRERMDQQRGS